MAGVMLKGDSAWFIHDRFGMFIHFGLYSLASRHEWIKNREEMDDAAYQKYFDHFDPDLYNPREWARAAREAGMKYMVVTTKHHEGFCLWDSKLTDYKVTNTPYGKDLLRPLVEAFRAEGLRVGFYYSLIDWHHPDFPIDGMHPQRNHPQAAELNQERDIKKYAEYMRGQVRELLTEFGQIDVMWFDFSYSFYEYRGLPGKGSTDWEADNLIELVRTLQPQILVNNRLGRHYADFHTPEQYQPRKWMEIKGEKVVWETCQTFSGSWGYHRDEPGWKSADQLIQMLINTVASGGNLLMNVGPTPRGTFDVRALKALEAYSVWLRLHSSAIYGCTQSEFQAPPDCRFTQNGKRLYLHIFNWPFRQLHLDGMKGQVEYAQLLNDGSEIPLEGYYPGQEFGLPKPDTGDTLTLELPVQKPDVIVPVIELFLS